MPTRLVLQYNIIVIHKQQRKSVEGESVHLSLINDLRPKYLYHPKSRVLSSPDLFTSVTCEKHYFSTDAVYFNSCHLNQERQVLWKLNDLTECCNDDALIKTSKHLNSALMQPDIYLPMKRKLHHKC